MIFVKGSKLRLLSVEEAPETRYKKYNPAYGAAFGIITYFDKDIDHEATVDWYFRDGHVESNHHVYLKDTKWGPLEAVSYYIEKYDINQIEADLVKLEQRYEER